MQLVIYSSHLSFFSFLLFSSFFFHLYFLFCLCVCALDFASRDRNSWPHTLGDFELYDMGFYFEHWAIQRVEISTGWDHETCQKVFGPVLLAPRLKLESGRFDYSRLNVNDRLQRSRNDLLIDLQNFKPFELGFWGHLPQIGGDLRLDYGHSYRISSLKPQKHPT